MALTTTTTWLPSFWARMALRAAARIFWLSATLEPPNFCTMIGMTTAEGKQPKGRGYGKGAYYRPSAGWAQPRGAGG